MTDVKMIESLCRGVGDVWRRLRRADFARDVLLLSGGTGIAQFIGLAILPVLSRLYSPQDFGLMTLYVSIVAVWSLFASFAYESAIMLSRSHRSASQLVWLILTISLLAATAALIVVMLFHHQIATFLGAPSAESWFWSLPLALGLTSGYQALRYWKMRLGQFNVVALSMIVRAVVFAAVAIALGYFVRDFLGGDLIAAFLLSEFAKITVLVASVRTADHKQFASANWRRINAVRRRHGSLAATLTVTGGMAIIYERVPDFVIASYFGAATLGLYGMVDRMVAAPSRLVSNAIGDVFRQRGAELYRTTGRFGSLTLNTLGSTGAIAIVPFVLMILYAPQLFALVLGTEWKEVGHFASILLVGEFFAFVITPIDKAIVIVGAKRFLFAWHTMRLVLTLALLPLVAYHVLDFSGFLWGLVVVRILMVSLW